MQSHDLMYIEQQSHDLMYIQQQSHDLMYIEQQSHDVYVLVVAVVGVAGTRRALQPSST